MRKRLFSFILMLSMLFIVASCGQPNEVIVEKEIIKTVEKVVEKEKREDIIISFTNDVHCGIDDNLGYEKLKAYADERRQNNKYFTLCDSGDAVQGSTIGTVTQGMGIVQIMNEAKYDIATIGNHEFDYGVDRLKELVLAANYDYLTSNITYTGNKSDNFLNHTKKYVIKDYDGVKVGYIGVTTPSTIFSSTPIYFKEGDQQVYHFGNTGDEKKYYEYVQEIVDSIKDKTDYIVALAHLGYSTDPLCFESSNYMISKTNGIDAVLDAHSHEAYTNKVKNKDGQDVVLCQTGTKLANIGEVRINSKGVISANLISSYDRKSESMAKVISDIKASYETELMKVAFISPVDMPLTDKDNIRMVRNRETAIGDFVADAYRITMGADIGYVNGGGVRAGIKKGNVTINDLIMINPFGNSLCVVEVTGAEILDMLEYFYAKVMSDYKNDGHAIGESGAFGNLSGIKCVVDTSIASSIVTDANDSLLSVGTSRRVKDVKILSGDEYVDIDLNKTYTLASHDYMVKNGGCGMEFLLANHNVIVDSAKLDYQAIIEYASIIEDINLYTNPLGRVTII